MSRNRIKFLSLEDLNDLSTISVEEASHLLGLSRTATYEACDRGEIPLLRVGKRIRVLARPLHTLLTTGSTSLASRTEVEA